MKNIDESHLLYEYLPHYCEIIFVIADISKMTLH